VGFRGGGGKGCEGGRGGGGTREGLEGEGRGGGGQGYDEEVGWRGEKGEVEWVRGVHVPGTGIYVLGFQQQTQPCWQSTTPMHINVTSRNELTIWMLVVMPLLCLALFPLHVLSVRVPL